MFFKRRRLCAELNQYPQIIIYGTGDFARKVYPWLAKYGLKKKIVCFAQTEESDTAFIDGIPITNISRLKYNKDECVVLIATSDLYANEIRKTLVEHNYLHIVSLTDYCTYKTLEADYRELETFEEYCEYIADWYAGEQKGNWEDSITMQEIWAERASIGRTTDTNLIVMICGHLSSRTIKIAGALKRKKYNIVFLSCFDGTNPWNLDELQKLGIQMHQCRCVEEMLYYALQYLPLVYFFEPRWGDCLWAEIMLKNKQYFGKIVLALYDVMNDGFIVKEEGKLTTEKYALEHADGIVWRWFFKEFLEEKGFHYQGKSIQFLDYCSHENENIVSNNADASIVRLCLISGYGDEYIEDREYATKYTDWARIGEILEKIGNRSDCCFHFYVGALQNRENIMRCRQYEKQYSNFKFFLGTEHDKLLKRFKDYDYGCELWIDGEDPPDDMAIRDQYGSIYHYSVRNAFFDYISAGLPVITTQASKMREHLGAEDVFIRMTLSDLDIDYLKEHKQYYKAKVAERRKEWDIDNQIFKLIQFFKEIYFFGGK